MQKHSLHWIMRRKVRNLLSHFAVRLPILHAGQREDAHHSTPLLIARTLEKELFLLPGMANRHGLITGATGTGKTVTLQKLAESFSEIGVPVFMADVKGDLTGIAQEGTASENIPHHHRTTLRLPVGHPDIFQAIRCARPYPTSALYCWRGSSI